MKMTLVVALFGIFACSSKNEVKVENKKISNAISHLHSSSLKKLEGSIRFESLKEEIKVSVDLAGLEPNKKLGFHVHENGFCEGPTYESAGGHLNPYHQKHGRPEGKARHLGDMGNIVTNSEGKAKQIILLPKTESQDLNLLISRSIIIHKNKDNFKSQPSGNAGDRIACGLIKPTE
jgi:superoxide dismutase, Cu-Zn family